MPCVRCGYDLRGSVRDLAGEIVICPECGERNYVDDLTEPLPELPSRRQVFLLAFVPVLPLIGACFVAGASVHVACATAVFWPVYLIFHCWLLYIAAKPRSHRDARFTVRQAILLCCTVLILDSAAMVVFFARALQAID
ncbi:MAG: hypothetical protein JSV91_00915 [Phycisphaerales bacterium]|nr:MAG: hypothetical protein JSV91_00915 [Phycisphaerales bacterium]